jgi:hypothetical protein
MKIETYIFDQQSLVKLMEYNLKSHRKITKLGYDYNSISFEEIKDQTGFTKYVVKVCKP